MTRTLVAGIVETCIDGEETDMPPAPFISSSLQMAAGNALKWSPDKTMKVAQRLYEQGLITYHRTDNPNISKDSMPDIRAVAKALGLKCVEQQRMFKADQDAQEGHPAITPTDWMAATAGETADEQALYQLIRVRHRRDLHRWRRNRYASATFHLLLAPDGRRECAEVVTRQDDEDRPAAV